MKAMGYSHQGQDKEVFKEKKETKEKVLCFAIDSLRQTHAPVTCLSPMLLHSMTKADSFHGTLETSSSLSHSSIEFEVCRSYLHW